MYSYTNHITLISIFRLLMVTASKPVFLNISLQPIIRTYGQSMYTLSVRGSLDIYTPNNISLDQGGHNNLVINNKHFSMKGGGGKWDDLRSSQFKLKYMKTF